MLLIGWPFGTWWHHFLFKMLSFGGLFFIAAFDTARLFVAFKLSLLSKYKTLIFHWGWPLRYNCQKLLANIFSRLSVFLIWEIRLGILKGLFYEISLLSTLTLKGLFESLPSLFGLIESINKLLRFRNWVIRNLVNKY